MALPAVDADASRTSGAQNNTSLASTETSSRHSQYPLKRPQSQPLSHMQAQQQQHHSRNHQHPHEQQHEQQLIQQPQEHEGREEDDDDGDQQQQQQLSNTHKNPVTQALLETGHADRTNSTRKIQPYIQLNMPAAAHEKHSVPLKVASSDSLSPTAVVACIAYAASSTLVTLLNKIVFTHSWFHYPWTTLAVQNILSVLLISVGRLFGFTSAGTYSRKVARDMTIPIICFVLFIFTNAQSLRYINIPVLTVWKSLGPLFVTLFERFYFGDMFCPRVYYAMALIALSALVTSINDLEFSVIGYFFAAANVVANVAYLASLRIYLRSPHVSSLDKTFHSNLLSLIPIGILAIASNETPHVLRDFQTTSMMFKFIFILSGFLTTAVCATAFWTISLTNGSTVSFIGGMNKVPMILISLVIFETRMSIAGWMGVVLGILAGFIFMRAKAMSPLSNTAQTSSALDSSMRPGIEDSNRQADLSLKELPSSGSVVNSSRLAWSSSRHFGWLLSLFRKKLGFTGVTTSPGD